MKRILLILSLLTLAPWAPALEKEPPAAYQARRSALASKLSDGVTVVFGYAEADTSDALTAFRQNDDFYYLTGVNEPGAILLLARCTSETGTGLAAGVSPAGPCQDAGFTLEILFLPPRSPRQERWTGPKLGPDDADVRRQTGFPTVLSTAEFDKQLKEILPAYRALYTVLPSKMQEQRCSFETESVNRLKKLAPAADIRDAAPEIARLRQVKSPGEVALIEKALRASMHAHREAMKALRPGMFEYQAAALMKYVFEREGCERPAYAPIVGSGFNSTVLHYSANTRRMEAGDLVVMDVGGEYSGYAADITRTLPVSRKFTRRQREIYEIVLGAQKAVIAAIKPGAAISQKEGSLAQIAINYFNAHGKDRNGRPQPLGQYFIHGISHHLGLNVHDAGSTSRPLEPGMVITVEPGLYIPEENLGVRIEDVVLVTENGARVLTEALPREPKDVERAMKK